MGRKPVDLIIRGSANRWLPATRCSTAVYSVPRFCRDADKNKQNGQGCGHNAECQNRPSATLRTFVHVSHDDFSADVG
jgi:hypothetical protein